MAHMLLVNSKGRKRRASKKKRTRAISVYKKARKSGKRRRAFRRNPIGGMGRGLMGKVVATTTDSAIGAGGALLTAVVASKLPLPDALKGPIATPLVNGALGIGLGMLVATLGGKRLGEQVAAGAVTVTIYETLKGAMGKQLGLSGYGDLLAYDEMSGYGDLLAYDEMGAYQNPAPTWSNDSGVGAYDTANEF